MQRRDFIWIVGSGIVACTLGCEQHDEGGPTADADNSGAGDNGGTGGGGGGNAETGDAGVDACAQHFVEMHDTYAQALYLDGTNGPLTGTVTTAHVIAGAVVTMDFWHGHNGIQHRFTLEPQHFAMLKQGQRITVGTTTVDGHAHTLFVDPKDEAYRVPGAPDVAVPIGC